MAIKHAFVSTVSGLIKRSFFSSHTAGSPEVGLCPLGSVALRCPVLSFLCLPIMAAVAPVSHRPPTISTGQASWVQPMLSLPYPDPHGMYHGHGCGPSFKRLATYPTHAPCSGFSGHWNLWEQLSSQSRWEQLSKSRSLPLGMGTHFEVMFYIASWWDYASVTYMGTCFDNSSFIGFLPFPVSCPHSTTSVSWEHLPNKLLMLKGLFGVDFWGLTSVQGVSEDST